MIVNNGINKLDIVYTYVNNKDVKWQEKYKKYIGGELDYGRFNFNGEIFFSLLTVQKFFNWVNKIYIVNDDQEFDLNFLDEKFRKKIKFIDHTKIIPSEYLPTFNSNVIECFLWKIKKLQDFFIYMNDDMFFGNYVYYSNFFTIDNQFKIFFKNKIVSKIALNKCKHLLGRHNADIIFNKHFKTDYHIYSLHASFNFNKYLCKLVYKIFNKYLKRTMQLKTRTYDTINNTIDTAKTFSFVQLSSLILLHTKIGVMEENINHLNIQQLDNNSYNEIFNKKPFFIIINQLYGNQIDLWTKLQKNYLESFDNKYSNFISNLKKIL